MVECIQPRALPMSVANPTSPDLRHHQRESFRHSPLVVFYEITRACNLVCRHCRTEPQRTAHPDELSLERSRQLIGEIRTFPSPPTLVFSGGDPFKRPDLPDLVQYATKNGLHTGLTPSATPLVTFDGLRDLKSRGLGRITIALDGASPDVHDGIRGVCGIYAQTLQIIRWAHDLELPVQINTTLCQSNLHQLNALALLLTKLKISTWFVYFLLPPNSTLADQRIGGDQIERVFDQLWTHAQTVPFPIKTGQAPHYRRFVQRIVETKSSLPPTPQRTLARYGSHTGTNDGKGLLYITHSGEICPSGYLPIVCGRFPFDSVVKTYQQHELFKALRDENRLGGKCGVCTYRFLCGGSRARAYALTGDPLAPEPDCLGHFPECPSAS
jgi:AdoMet-dependent heme synthase